MQNKLISTATTLIALAATLAPLALAAPQQFKGTISDSMCLRKHMLPGKTDAQCVEECIHSGSNYVLMAGDKNYTLSAKKGQLSPFAGRNVTLTGELKGSTITVVSVH